MNPGKTVCVVFLLLLLPTFSHGAAYVQVNYGFGGTTDEQSWGGEIGAVFLSDWHPQGNALCAGIGFSVGDTDENPPETSAAIPATAVSTMKKYNDGREYEGYISCGAELVPSFFGVLALGYATQDELSVGMSSGVYYETDSKTEKYVTGMAMVRYVVEGFTAGLGFHTRRGVVCSMGLAF